MEEEKTKKIILNDKKKWHEPVFYQFLLNANTLANPNGADWDYTEASMCES